MDSIHAWQTRQNVLSVRTVSSVDDGAAADAAPNPVNAPNPPKVGFAGAYGMMELDGKFVFMFMCAHFLCRLRCR